MAPIFVRRASDTLQERARSNRSRLRSRQNNFACKLQPATACSDMFSELRNVARRLIVRMPATDWSRPATQGRIIVANAVRPSVPNGAPGAQNGAYAHRH